MTNSKSDPFSVIQDFHKQLSEKYPHVKPESWAALAGIASIKYLKKDETFINYGGRLHAGVFVLSGYLKLSHSDENGNERISAFCRNTDYIDNWNAIHQQQPLSYTIAAIAPTVLLLYPLEKMIRIFNERPDLLQLCILLSQEMIRLKNEHYQILSLASPEEKYRYLLHKHRNYLQDISTTDLARFLHISREALSRAKSKILRTPVDPNSY